MIAPSIMINNASLIYGNKTVFSQLNVNFPAGKWISILGQSGIGKSSLLRMIAGLIPAEKTICQGYIYTDNDLPLRDQVAYMAQTDLLLPWINVLNNTLLGLKLRGKKKFNVSPLITRAKTLLEEVGLGDALYHYPHQLSGGMRQRVSLVRTLMEDKPIILMDEPFSSLDAITAHQLQSLAVKLLQNKTIIFITHDPIEALRLAHVIYVMQKKPGALTFITNLTSEAPRDLHHRDLITWQPILLNALSMQERSAL